MSLLETDEEGELELEAVYYIGLCCFDGCRTYVLYDKNLQKYQFNSFSCMYDHVYTRTNTYEAWTVYELYCDMHVINYNT